MPSPTDLIQIPRAELENWWTAIDTAHKYHVADDLTREFKNVGGTHRPSNLTKRLEAALDRLDAFLMEEDESVSET